MEDIFTSDKRLIDCIHPNFSNVKIQLETLNQPYLVFYPSPNEGDKEIFNREIYERANCDSATHCSYDVFRRSGQRMDATFYAFLDGTARVYVDLPGYPNYKSKDNRIKFSKEGAEMLIGCLEERLYKIEHPLDKFAAGFRKPIDEYIAEELIMQAIERDEKADAVGSVSDYYINLGSSRILYTKMKEDGRTQEVHYNASRADFEKMLSRACVETFLKNQKYMIGNVEHNLLEDFEEQGRQAKVIATVNYSREVVPGGVTIDTNKTEVSLLVNLKGNNYSFKVPADAKEKNLIRSGLREHNIMMMNLAQQNRDQERQILIQTAKNNKQNPIANAAKKVKSFLGM